VNGPLRAAQLGPVNVQSKIIEGELH
jgi:hypothetical protein